jgi:hypothetical protein
MLLKTIYPSHLKTNKKLAFVDKNKDVIYLSNFDKVLSKLQLEFKSFPIRFA